MNFLILSHRFPKKNNTCLEKDFARKLREKGHNVFVVTTVERRLKKETHIYEENGIKVLYVKTGNRTKDYNLIEKIITILSTPFLIKKELKKNFLDLDIDYLITYTPFMSNLSLVKFLTKKYMCKNILFLWDIMPQTAKDMNIIKSNFIFKFLKKREKELYSYVDKIICNCTESVRYIISNKYKNERDIIFFRNPEYLEEKVSDFDLNIISKYNYKEKDVICIFGGNMGMLQKLDNLLELAKKITISNVKFLLVGDGKDKLRLEKRIKEENINNVKILDVLPREEYEQLMKSASIGLICLNEKNTVPNFPTKVTGYLKLGIPIFGILDSSAGRGVGSYLIQNNIGIWSKAGDLKDTLEKFYDFLNKVNSDYYNKNYLKSIYRRDFDIEKAYNTFIKEI